MMEVTEENDRDPFVAHFQYNISPTAISSYEKPVYETTEVTWSEHGKLLVRSVKISELSKEDSTLCDNQKQTYAKTPKDLKKLNLLSDFCIRKQIINHIEYSNDRHAGVVQGLNLFQFELLSLLYEYRDLYYTERTYAKAEEIRLTYCLHIVNHVLKSRINVMKHDNKLGVDTDIEVPDDYRDQGLVRPKVLILVPFRDCVLRIVKMISTLLLGEQNANIINKRKAMDEFSGSEITNSQKKSRPTDYEEIFQGNIDDNFKIGISLTKKNLKLYTDFYTSDIIIASPVGLRSIIGAEGEKERDFDFLSSIEILLLDQTDIFLMQNWDHVLHIFDHLHKQPKESHGTDFSRVRTWAIDGLAKFYRQTLIFTSYPIINISALTSRCCNYAGLIRTNNAVEGNIIDHFSVSRIHVFHKITGKSALDTADVRFNAFLDIISERTQQQLVVQTLVYIPSYFDFVRIRNHFKTEALSFVQISEYTKDKKVAEARDKFFHKEANIMLYSERFHFFRRRKIRGVRRIIFYQLPTFPNFYSELVNFIEGKDNSEDTEIISLYSKYDAPQLTTILGTKQATRMIISSLEDFQLTIGDNK